MLNNKGTRKMYCMILHFLKTGIFTVPLSNVKLQVSTLRVHCNMFVVSICNKSVLMHISRNVENKEYILECIQYLMFSTS